jgi:hypothetical protein
MPVRWWPGYRDEIAARRKFESLMGFLSRPTMIESAAAIGGSPQEFAGPLAEEAPKWLDVVRSAGFKID